MHPEIHTQQYHGYAIVPSAYRLPDGWFSSNILLSRGNPRETTPMKYRFDALAYFESEHLAIEHALAWGHDWIDDRG